MRLVEQPFVDPVELLILDYNGIMLNDLSFGIGAMELIFRMYDLPVPSKSQIRAEFTGEIMRFYWNRGIPRRTTLEDLSLIRNAYYRARLDQIHFRSGLRKLLDRCRARELRLAICSGETKGIFYPTINREGLRGYFSIIRVEAWNGKTLELRKICHQAGVAYEHAVYVDDIADGVRVAREAGLKSIGFANATSWNTAARIEAANPDRIAHELKDLRTILKL